METNKIYSAIKGDDRFNDLQEKYDAIHLVFKMSKDIIEKESRELADKIYKEEIALYNAAVWQYSLEKKELSDFDSFYGKSEKEDVRSEWIQIIAVTSSEFKESDNRKKRKESVLFKVVNSVLITRGGGYVIKLPLGYVCTVKEQLDLQKGLVPECMRF